MMAEPKLMALMALALMLALPVFGQQDGAAAQQDGVEAGSEDEVLEDLETLLDEDMTDTYVYDPQGRRDPFRSLIRGNDAPVRTDVPPGPPGFLIDEINLQGIVRTPRGWVASIKGPDNVGYALRVGDELFDGEVLRITADAVYFRQEVNDPTRIERQREVVKKLDESRGGA